MAHFEPDTVHVYGEGVFPRVSLDLPRLHDPEGQYEKLVTASRENLLQEYQGKDQHSDNPGDVTIRVSRQSELYSCQNCFHFTPEFVLTHS